MHNNLPDHTPFPKNEELITSLTDSTIPDGTADRLGDELSCPVLEELYAVLDFVGRKSSSHIDPVHRHVQKGRRIVVTEDPGLHLIWHRGIVYIKPLPPFLLSHAFWTDHLGPGSAHRGEALGFVRSYERLIRHPSDFAFAQEARLIPAAASSSSSSSSSFSSSSTSSASLPSAYPAGRGEEGVGGGQGGGGGGGREQELSYTALVTFLRRFSDVSDAEVSPRWHFGQLRLSRLNWAVRLVQPAAARQKGGFQHRLFYGEQYWQTGQLLREFAAPGLFAFAALSLILSAMQVVLAARSFSGGDSGGGGGGGGGGESPNWRIFADVSTWFSIVLICVLVASFFGLAVVMVGIWAWQMQFSYRSWNKSVAECGSLRDREARTGGEVRIITYYGRQSDDL